MLPDEAASAEKILPPTPGRGRRIFTRKFLFVSLAAHLLFAAGAAYWVVAVRPPPPKRTFHAGPASSNRAARTFEHQVQMTKRKNVMSAPPAAKRITTTNAAAKLSLPAMPPMPASRPALAAPTQMAGLSGAAMMSLGAAGPGSASAGFGQGSSGTFVSAIGGLNIKAQRLAVALDVSGSVKAYQEQMHAYVTKTFKGSEIGEFKSAGFYVNASKGASISSVLLGFLNSPKHFDAIYVFSDFGETKDEQPQLEEVQKLIREKKVRLYLHVLREYGKESKINPALASVISFARGTGGNVKIGPMQRVSDSGNSGEPRP